jgi:hypothetical protein
VNCSSRSFPAILLGLVLCSSPATLRADDISAAKPTVPSVRIDLFNGKSFSGWTFCMRSNSDPSAVWSVTNGVIHCTGKAVGYLRTEKRFQNY